MCEFRILMVEITENWNFFYPESRPKEQVHCTGNINTRKEGGQHLGCGVQDQHHARLCHGLGQDEDEAEGFSILCKF